MSSSSVRLVDDEYVFVELGDDLNLETAQRVTRDVVSFSEQLRAQNRRVMIVCNISGSMNVDQPTRNYILDTMNHLQYDKIAAYGPKSLMRNIANITLMAFGKLDKTKLFDTQDQALFWIRLATP